MEASELFDILEAIAAAPPSHASQRRLHQLIALTAAEGCRQQRGTFGNLFAQVDWVCKTYGITADDKWAIQAARRNTSLNTTPARPDQAVADKEEQWRYDLRAVARFISTVFRTAIPSTLLRLLPANSQSVTQHKDPLRRGKDYVRCIVRQFDQQTIVADTGEEVITVDYGNTEQGRDFVYLRKILREGMQLNLLDCMARGEDGGVRGESGEVRGEQVIIPGLIIVEPDFLIDISSLAACFTGYGHHPLLYTIARLKPRPNTQATLLGNFAGTALDAVINNSQTGTGQMLRRAFREDALRYCACTDFDAQRFRANAEQQVQHIREAVDALFDTHQRSKAIVEPSFVCERLGLQGRVDLMTSDMQLLVEQKAGKNMKIERNSRDSYGLQQESHYVQLLLYYGVLRYNFKKSDAQVDTRLLYSRYPATQGLVAVNYYRTLFREALRLRNQVVATELLIARDGFGRILPLLSADVVYKDVARDGWFHRFVMPEIETIATTLATLSHTERAYFERMMTFVYREQVCQKLGNGETTLQHNSGAASNLWLMPLDEKIAAGNIITDLRIVEHQRSDQNGGYDTIVLADEKAEGEKEQLDASNFRRGDMVYLYSYKDMPDVRKSILYKGTLQSMETGRITILLNEGQQNVGIFAIGDGRRWAVEHGGSDANTTSCIKGLFLFAQANPRRRALLMGQRQPEADTTVTLSRNYSPHYDDIVLKASQARDYFLLVGPPGTGKTSMALRFIIEEHLTPNTRHPSPSAPYPTLLLMAYTNRAVDEICAMLTDADKDFLRIGNAASCDPRFNSHLIDVAAKEHPSLDELRQVIDRATIIVGTTSMLQARPFIFQLKHFSMAIIDEASQILEPGLIGLLCSEQIDRFVLIGDHKQLPAVVVQGETWARVDEPCLHAIGLRDCRQSLFERLYRWEQAQGRTQFIGTLSHQGRMHPDVARFPSHFFYADQLLPVPCPHQKEERLSYATPSEDALDDLLKSRRMVFFPVKHAPSELLTANIEEARLVADLLRRIHRFYGSRFQTEQTVGVIVPYRNQISAIQQQVEKLDIEELCHVTIDTVERYQGSQRDVIIYSFTVSLRSQLDFLAGSTCMDNGQLIDRKLNVALTRARHQTLMVGNPFVLRHNPLYRQLIESYSAEVSRHAGQR